MVEKSFQIVFKKFLSWGLVGDICKHLIPCNFSIVLGEFGIAVVSEDL